MKTKLSLALLTVISLLTLFNASCTGETAAETAAETVADRTDYIELMQKTPGSYQTLTMWDVKALRADPELATLCEAFYDHRINYLEKEYGIDGQSIDYFAECDPLRILKLDYDIGVFTESLSRDFYRDTSYKDREVWRNEPATLPSMPIGSWVLEEDLLIKGLNKNSVDAYLRVADGEEPPLYNVNVANLLAMLPQGIVITVRTYPFLNGVTARGTSIEKAGDKTFTLTDIFLFESAEAASSAEANEYFERLEADLREGETSIAEQGLPPYYSDFKIKRNGAVVTNTMLANEDYLIYCFFYD